VVSWWEPGLVLVASGGCLGPVSERHHGYAPRHRVVEQAADKARFGMKGTAAEQQEKEEQGAHGNSIE